MHELLAGFYIRKNLAEINIKFTARTTSLLELRCLKQGSTAEFKDGQNQFRAPFIMYADFESILEPMDPVEPGSPSQPYTNEVNQHTPSGWCVYNKFAYGDVDNPLRTYRGKDCIETFCNYIKGEARRLYHMFPELPMGN